MKNKKYYVDSFGVFSLSKSELIDVLESMLKNNGAYDLCETSGKYLKSVKANDYDCFTQNGKLKIVSMNLVRVTDKWDESGAVEVEYLLNQLKA